MNPRCENRDSFGNVDVDPLYERYLEERCYEEDVIHNHKDLLRIVKLESALQLIAAPKNLDGTFKRDRETCQIMAKEALKR